MSAIVEFPAKPEARPYLAGFAERAADEPRLAGARRRQARALCELGFPTRRSESWRFTNLRPLATAAAAAAGERARVERAADRLARCRCRRPIAASCWSTAALPRSCRRSHLPPGVGSARPRRRRSIASGPIATPERSPARRGPAVRRAQRRVLRRRLRARVEPGVDARPAGRDHPLGPAQAEASFHRAASDCLGEDSRATVIESYAGRALLAQCRRRVRLGDGAELVARGRWSRKRRGDPYRRSSMRRSLRMSDYEASS